MAASRSFGCCLLLVLLLLLIPGFAQAAARKDAQGLQEATNPQLPPRIGVITMEPGEAFWERFGHDAIVVIDPASGEGISYNFGFFDMAEPGFVGNFIRGYMRYYLVALPVEEDLPTTGPRAAASPCSGSTSMATRRAAWRQRWPERAARKRPLPIRLLPRQLLHPRARRDWIARSVAS